MSLPHHPLPWREMHLLLQQQGWSDFEIDIPVKTTTLDVWQRELSVGCGWEYLVLSTQDSRTSVLTPEPLKSSPGISLLKDLAIQAQLIEPDPEDDPWFGLDYAIEIDGGNDYPSNFPTERLRDRALSETLLDPVILENDDERRGICLFEIEPNGDQDESKQDYRSVADHAHSGLAEIKGSTMRAWFAAMSGNLEFFSQAITDGADIYWRNGSGDSLLDAAAGCPEIVAVLQAKMAKDTIAAVSAMARSPLPV